MTTRQSPNSSEPERISQSLQVKKLFHIITQWRNKRINSEKNHSFKSGDSVLLYTKTYPSSIVRAHANKSVVLRPVHHTGDDNQSHSKAWLIRANESQGYTWRFSCKPHKTIWARYIRNISEKISAYLVRRKTRRIRSGTDSQRLEKETENSSS